MSKEKIYLYVIYDQEFDYDVSLDYILMEIHKKKKMKNNPIHDDEILECNDNFYHITKELKIDLYFIHIDKD